MAIYAQSKTVAPTNLDADGISLSQSPVGAVNFTLNGAAVSGGVATMGAAQKITVTSAGADTGRTFTITGTDANGEAQTEGLTGASGAAATSAKFYKTVTSIATDATTAGAITAGFTAVSVSPSFDATKLVNTLTLGCNVTGTITYGAEYSIDLVNWTTHATITGKSAAFDGTVIFPIRAIRLTVASATTGTVTGTLLCWNSIG